MEKEHSDYGKLVFTETGRRFYKEGIAGMFQNNAIN